MQGTSKYVNVYVCTNESELFYLFKLLNEKKKKNENSRKEKQNMDLLSSLLEGNLQNNNIQHYQRNISRPGTYSIQ